MSEMSDITYFFAFWGTVAAAVIGFKFLTVLYIAADEAFQKRQESGGIVFTLGDCLKILACVVAIYAIGILS